MSLPSVLLAGDSISAGYGPGVVDILQGEFGVSRIPGNGGTSANLLAHIDDWLVAPEADVIHLNCGLHGLAIHRDAGGPTVPLETYQANLKTLIGSLRRNTSSILLWASTTPVISDRHVRVKGFNRREEDVVAYNRAAAGIMADNSVPIDDLHRVVEDGGRQRCVGEDGVHMTELGNDLLARAVADFLRSTRP